MAHQRTTSPLPNPPTPKTPLTLYKDNFELTPNTQTTTSFADSGFFSSPPGKEQCFGTGYTDWVLFPAGEDEQVKGWEEGEGSGFLDTSGFFKDADECVMLSPGQGQEELESSTTLPAYSPQALTRDLENLTISSPQPPQPQLSSPPASPRPKNLTFPSPSFLESQIKEEKAGKDTTMLTTWYTQNQRHESIAYRFEQPPYTEREHLLMPVFRQSMRVERKRRSAGAGAGTRKLRRERGLVGR